MEDKNTMFNIADEKGDSKNTNEAKTKDVCLQKRMRVVKVPQSISTRTFQSFNRNLALAKLCVPRGSSNS